MFFDLFSFFLWVGESRNARPLTVVIGSQLQRFIKLRTEVSFLDITSALWIFSCFETVMIK